MSQSVLGGSGAGDSSPSPSGTYTTSPSVPALLFSSTLLRLGATYFATVVTLERLFAWKLLREDNFPLLTRFVGRQICTRFPYSWVSFVAHYRKPWQVVDETVVLGSSPMLWDAVFPPFVSPGSVQFLRKLQKEANITAIVNLQDEYHSSAINIQDAVVSLQKLVQLHLPTVDHHEPRLKNIHTAVKLLDEYDRRNKQRRVTSTVENKENEMQTERVYVHCKGGKGRSAAVVICYQIWKLRREAVWSVSEERRQSGDEGKGFFPDTAVELEKLVQTLNMQLGIKKRVRKKLWKQPNVRAFAAWVQSLKQEEIEGYDFPAMPAAWEMTLRGS
eukprot:g16194.t1